MEKGTQRRARPLLLPGVRDRAPWKPPERGQQQERTCAWCVREVFSSPPQSWLWQRCSAWTGLWQPWVVTWQHRGDARQCPLRHSKP